MVPLVGAVLALEGKMGAVLSETSNSDTAVTMECTERLLIVEHAKSSQNLTDGEANRPRENLKRLVELALSAFGSLQALPHVLSNIPAYRGERALIVAFVWFPRLHLARAPAEAMEKAPEMARWNTQIL
jgi:hypothetical protein